MDPLEEGLHPWLAVREAMAPLGIPGELEGADIFFDPIERADLLERFAHGLGSAAWASNSVRRAWRPALRVREAELLGVAVIGGVTVGEQHGTGDGLRSQEPRTCSPAREGKYGKHTSSCSPYTGQK